jgi:tetratricopeptide (TPR) repeat protein
MWHYARGLTFARLGDLEQANPEFDALAAVARDPDMDALILLSGTKAQALLEIAELVLHAEVESVRGHHPAALEHLEKAIEAQDALPYSEPAPWYFPIRQALGTKLLELGQVTEAEAVYRRDLEDHPNSGWSLGGLVDSLKAQGRFIDAQAVGARFEEAWPLADITLGRGSSCCGSGAPPKQGGR